MSIASIASTAAKHTMANKKKTECLSSFSKVLMQPMNLTPLRMHASRPTLKEVGSRLTKPKSVPYKIIDNPVAMKLTALLCVYSPILISMILFPAQGTG